MQDNIKEMLALRERELDLLLGIDDIRDAVGDDVPPGVMFGKLLKLLMNHLAADAAAITVLSEDNQPEYQQSVGVPHQKGVALCQQVIQATSKPEVHSVGVDGWRAGVGVRVDMGDQPLGAVVLLRKDHRPAFDEDDYALLKTAEKQLDSAVVQVRRIWRLSQRNRELDVIYRLDQIRDENSDENDLISSFTQIIMEQFEAKLCMVILSHIDSGEMIVRSTVDKVGLKPKDFQAILQGTEHMTAIGGLESPREGLFLSAAPFIVASMQLGAVVVGRDKPFTPGDDRLLFALSTQMDSAVVYSRVIQQLTQRNKELEIIYNIDKIRDSDMTFDAMLQAVLAELRRAIDSEVGFILLFNSSGDDMLEVQSTDSSGVTIMQGYHNTIQAYSRKALDSAGMVFENDLRGVVRSVVAVPLVLHDKIIGVFGAVNNRNPLGFTAEDRRMLHAIVTQVDTAVFEQLEQRRVRQVLGRSVDPKVLEHLLANTDAAHVLEGERAEISVLFADLRGSTEWAERTEPDDLAYVLNQYLGRMTEVIFEFGGTLDKFVGDEVIGLFGAPLAMDDHSERCTAAAHRMQQVMADMQRELAKEGYELPPMGVGVSSGEAICGEFGTAQRTDYTAMGRMMNLGARLCGAAKGGEVVISEATCDALGDKAAVEKLGDVTLKGIGKATAYKLVSLHSE